MGSVQLSVPEMGETDKQTIQNLYDTILKYRKELQYLLTHLDDDNMGKITAKSLDLDTLIVGENIFMSPTAIISWANVDNKPLDLVYEAALNNYITDGVFSDALSYYLTEGNFDTLIGQDYIVTGKILANQIAAGLITGVTIKTASSVDYLKLNEQYLDFFNDNKNKMSIGFEDFLGVMQPYIKMGAGTSAGGYSGVGAAGTFVIEKTSYGLGEVFTTTNGNENQGFVIYDSGQAGYANGAMKFMGTLDFSLTTQIGLNGTAKFA